MNPYFPILILLGIGIGLGTLLSAFSHFLGPKKKYSKVKYQTYECGVPQASTGHEKMSVKYYLTAILFILFDIETIFLYLWAKTFKQLGWFGVAEIVIFMTILVAGYIYVLKRGALEWD